MNDTEVKKKVLLERKLKRYRELRVRFHEINGTPRMIFFLAQRKRRRMKSHNKWSFVQAISLAHNKVGSQDCFLCHHSWYEPRPVGLKVLFDDGWEEDCWTLPQSHLPFFIILSQEAFFSSSKSTETSNQVWHTGTDPHVCVAFVRFVVNCQGFRAKEEKKELVQSNTGILYRAIRPQVRGLLANAVSSVRLLCATRSTTQQCRCRVGQAYSSGSTPTEWTLKCMQMPWLKRGVKHFFPVIVFFYALAPGSLLSYAGRGWADEDVRLRQWPWGRMRRWRASSAWASLCHLLWSGRWLLSPQHSGWSLPVFTSAVAFVGGGDLFECSPTPLFHQVWSTLVADSRHFYFFFKSQICCNSPLLQLNLSLLGHAKV